MRKQPSNDARADEGSLSAAERVFLDAIVELLLIEESVTSAGALITNPTSERHGPPPTSTIEDKIGSSNA